MTIWHWSQTAADNDDADTSINWREGQAPSTINNAARAMMAAIAKWRDDLSGVLATSGTSTAYTLSSNTGIASLSTGMFVGFTPHTTSGAAPTLNVDGTGNKPLRGVSGADLPAGVLSEGTPYVAVYDSSNDEWLLRNFYEPPGGIPIGGIVDYAGSSAPNSSWLFCYGQAVSRTTYATLFARLGTTYGAGNGSTTFNLPDCRGRVRAGKDDMGGTSANRLTNQSGGLDGDTLGATGGAETHTLTEAQLAAHDHDAGELAASTTINGQSGRLVGTSTLSFTGGASNSTPTNSASLALTATTTISGSTADAGSGSAHNNVQPTIIFNTMIRAL